MGKWGMGCLNVSENILSTQNNLYKLTPEAIVVLSCRNPYISFYSYSNQLVREIISLDETCQLRFPIRFVLDTYFNIITNDIKSHCVCVFSYRGDLLHKFGKKGDQKGDFISPKGITICPEGRIIVTSNNQNHPIQIFW